MSLLLLAHAMTLGQATVYLLPHLLVTRLLWYDTIVSKGQLMQLSVALDAHLDLVTGQVAEYLFHPGRVITLREVKMVRRCIFHIPSYCQSTNVKNPYRLKANRGFGFFSHEFYILISLYIK